MTIAIKPVITQDGLASVLNQYELGGEAKIKYVAYGNANSIGYTPLGNETALRNELVRIPLDNGVRDGELSVEFSAVLKESPMDNDTIREVAILLEDGTVFAVWSDPDNALIYKNAGIDFVQKFNLFVSQIPPNSLNVTVTAADSSTLLDYPVLTSLKAISSLQLESIKTKIAVFDAAL